MANSNWIDDPKFLKKMVKNLGCITKNLNKNDPNLNSPTLVKSNLLALIFINLFNDRKIND